MKPLLTVTEIRGSIDSGTTELLINKALTVHPTTQTPEPQVVIIAGYEGYDGVVMRVHRQLKTSGQSWPTNLLVTGENLVEALAYIKEVGATHVFLDDASYKGDQLQAFARREDNQVVEVTCVVKYAQSAKSLLSNDAILTD